MDERKDGGLAFPGVRYERTGSLAGKPVYGDVSYPGMTLRDYFAGQALASLGDWTPNADDHSPPDWTDMAALRQRRAEWSYAMADAMLAAREVL